MTCHGASRDKAEYLVFTMGDCLISSYQTGGSGGGGEEVPTESISLNFSKIKTEYTPQSTDGSPGEKVWAAFDVKDVAQ